MIDRLKVGWKVYDVIYTEPDSNLILGGDHCYGKIHHDEQKIYINTQYDDTQKITTIIHEALHGIENLMSFDLEEKHVSALANGIAMIIADNPGLLTEMKILCKSTSE